MIKTEDPKQSDKSILEPEEEHFGSKLQNEQPHLPIPKTYSGPSCIYVSGIVVVAAVILTTVVMFVFDSYKEEVQSKIHQMEKDFKTKSIEEQKSCEKNLRFNKPFNLWDFTAEEKEKLLTLRKQAVLNKQIWDSSMEIVYHRDDEIKEFYKDFEATSTNVDFSSITIEDDRSVELKQTYQKILKERRTRQKNLIKEMESYKETKRFRNDGDHVKGIRMRQIYDALLLASLPGENIEENSNLKAYVQKQKKYLDEQYHISDYKTELPTCVIVPSYNNEADYRYIWNIESIIQQNYTNYHVVVVVDQSEDNTANLLIEYLKWRQVPKDKFVLITAQRRNTAMTNLYYTIHKFCNPGQILYVVDGDDELIGTQVFKVYNAIYQKQKPYVVYSSHLIYDQKNPYGQKLMTAISEDYPGYVKAKSLFRSFYHRYSQLRTMLTDIFFLIRKESFSSKNGELFWSVCDNAIFFSAMELACKKVEYIPDMFYWYNTNTGLNSYNTPIQKQKGAPEQEIEAKKPYSCIDAQLEKFVSKLDTQK